MHVGIEGITRDPQTSGFVVVKEKDPESIFQTGIDFAAGTAANSSVTTASSTDRPAGPTGPQGPRGLSGTLKVTIGSVSTKGRSVKVKLTNANAFTVAGTLSLRLNGKTLKRVSYRTAAKPSNTVTFTLSKSQYAKYKRAGKKAITYRLTGTASTGGTRTSTVKPSR